MANNSWVITLSAVASNGNVTQLYPSWAAVGEAPATASPSLPLRVPGEGHLFSVQIATDGTNGGTLELYDMNGADLGADVSSAATITNAQLVSALAAVAGLPFRRGRLMWQQAFAGTPGATSPFMVGQTFLRGLAGRFYNAGPTGTCTITLVVDGGYTYQRTAG
jgi:hypothetical protein